MNRTLVYWTCQLAGWGGFLGMNLATRTELDDSLDWGQGLLLTFACSCALLLSHVFRWMIQPRTWIRLSLRGLLPRILLFALLGGVILSLLMLGLGSLVDLPDLKAHDLNLKIMSLQVTNWALVFCGWITIYLAIHFFEAFQEARLEKWQIQATAREAELKSLKSQLNPHFLFNCLNSLRGLIAEDAEKAQLMVTQLASLLRYALHANEETVPLRDELRAVRIYLELEAIRLEDRLQYDFQVDEACLSVAVPPLLVQSLVENGIKHGVASLKQGGRLSVRAFREQDCLHIEVDNPGDRLETREREGVGLHNAGTRLRLIFGPKALLDLAQIEPHKIQARVIIPLEESDARRSG